MIGKRLFHKEFKIYSEGIFDANVLIELTHEKEFLPFTTPTPITFRNTEDINLINFGSKRQIERILFTKPCFIEKTFTGYFGYSEKVFDEHSLGEMFKNIIIFRDQKQEMEIYYFSI